MRPLYLSALISAAIALFALLLAVLAHGHGLPLLFPSGAVGIHERDVMMRATLLMLIVVVPVVILAIFIGWHYRESNTHAAYTPDWEHSRMEELIWWSIPFEIVLVLAAFTWTSTHQLDPMAPLPSSEPPLTVQVVALPWKWLFIYPQEDVASVNELVLPVDRPVEFQITADAPMNSFWIPALGGQMYAMTGMTTMLHLVANTPGDYIGRSANYSGDGFAQMQFAVHAMSETDYEAWIAKAASSSSMLTPEDYATLRKPSDAGPVRYYSMVMMTFAEILHQYMPAAMTMPGIDIPAHHH